MLTFAICVGTSVAVYMVPQLLAVPGDAYGFGASATAIGFFLLPGAAAAALAGPISGVWVRRHGARVVVTAGIVLLSAALFGLAAVHTELWHLIGGKAAIALANGLCVTALVAGIATSVERRDTGTATGLVLVTRVLGYAVGAQLSGALLTAATPSGSDIPAECAFVTGFVIAGAVTALSLFVARSMSKGVDK